MNLDASDDGTGYVVPAPAVSAQAGGIDWRDGFSAVRTLLRYRFAD